MFINTVAIVAPVRCEAMSSGAGYDLSVSTFSPDGRVYQVEYAAKAVENSGTVVGLCCKDGVVMGCEKFLTSKMLVPGTNRRILRVAKHAGIAMAGLVPWVANKRFEISKFKFKFPRARTYEIIGLVLGCIEANFCK